MRLRSFISAVVLLLLVGCASRIPKNINDCEISPYVEQWETVDDCKMAVIRKEDRRVEKEAKERENLIRSRLCFQSGGVWDTWSERCKRWDML